MVIVVKTVLRLLYLGFHPCKMILMCKYLNRKHIFKTKIAFWYSNDFLPTKIQKLILLSLTTWMANVYLCQVLLQLHLGSQSPMVPLS